MKIVFKEQIIDDELFVEPLFCWEYKANNVTLDTIIDSMYGLLTEEQKIRIFSLEAGDYQFFDRPGYNGKKPFLGIAILVKVVNGTTREILKVGSNHYQMEEFAELLNKECTDNQIKYLALKVRGELQ